MPRGGRNRYGEFDKVLDVIGEEEAIKSDGAQGKGGGGRVRGDLDMSDELKQVKPLGTT
jgi:hypothetical protein